MKIETQNILGKFSGKSFSIIPEKEDDNDIVDELWDRIQNYSFGRRSFVKSEDGTITLTFSDGRAYNLDKKKRY